MVVFHELDPARRGGSLFDMSFILERRSMRDVREEVAGGGRAVVD